VRVLFFNVFGVGFLQLFGAFFRVFGACVGRRRRFVLVVGKFFSICFVLFVPVFCGGAFFFG